MRNIGIQREIKRSLGINQGTGTGDDDQIVDLACVDESHHHNHHYGDDIVDGPVGILTRNGYVYFIDHDKDVTVSWQVNLTTLISSSEEPPPPQTTPAATTTNVGWFNLTYVEPNFVALHHNGSIVAIHKGEAELVGEFENGIRTAAWNFDRSVLTLVTTVIDDDDDEINHHNSTPETKEEPPTPQRHSVLLSLNTEWDVLAEVRIDRIDDGQPVSLCWTDAQLAINSVDSSDQMRKIRIYYGDTLELHAIGRTEDGSGKLCPNLQFSPISWAGSGCSNLLTALQSKGRTKTMVAFFEPNGLRHREFLIRNDGDTVTGLQWNAKSDLLAVTLQAASPGLVDTSPIQKVQLWYRCNYHWYMKYELRYHQPTPVVAKFHPAHAYILYILLDDLRWNVVQVRWDVSTKQTSTTAWSVDGDQLNMTDFNRAFVPPPMYAHTLTMPAPVHEIATTNMCRESSNVIYGVVSLADASFVILSCDEEKVDYPFIGRTVRFHDTSNYDLGSFRHLTIVDNEDTQLYLVAIVTSWDNNGVDFLVEIMICGDVAKIVGSHRLEQQCLTISPWLDSLGAGVLVQLLDGTLLEYYRTDEPVDDTIGGRLVPCTIESLLEPCPWIQCQRQTNDLDHQSRLVIGMSSNARLYCNDFQVADTISSFTISSENQFLCFATSGSACILRFIPLLDLINFDPLLGSDENSILLGYEPRSIERGSLLVSVLTKKPSAVLQMPRGNIEIIHPRALVLRHSMLKTMDMNYSEAFQLMRRQKVDLNLIVDMNPIHFLDMDGVTSFVEQVESIDYLNLFISCLQDWDSTKERYPIPYWIKSTQSDSEMKSDIDFSCKVNLVCGRIRSVMIAAQEAGHTKAGRTISEDHFLLPILSSFAKENPPKLEDALLMIQHNANKRQNGSSKPSMFSDIAQNSIQYLAFMADYELLFQTALGLYDFEMARAVARNSQMDPKVYLPLLQHYRSLPLHYGRYQVDVKLKRFESALRNLHESKRCGESIEINDGNGQKKQGNDFSEFLRLVEIHKQHRVGLEVCSDKDQRNLIFQSLGNQLLLDKKPQNALMVFLSAETVDEESCIRAAKECRDWSALFSLPIVIQDEPRRQRLAWEIAEDLSAHAESGQNNNEELLAGASRVLLDYGNDLSGAIKMLMKGELWSEARRIALLHHRDDLARKVVDAAISYAQNLVADLEDRAASFAQARSRYDDVLQIRKAAMRNAGIDSTAMPDVGDDASLFSAVSNASNLSMRSTASAGSTTSLSSVISVKSTTSFSVTGGDDANRHKSKYNVLGGVKAKKSKRKTKGSNRILPGSEEDLMGLVQTLKSNLVDDTLVLKIGETITFLIHTGHLPIGRAVHDSYVELQQVVIPATAARTSPNHQHEELHHHRHPVEAEVAALECAPLPRDIVDIFQYFPPT